VAEAETLRIGDQGIAAGVERRFELPVARLLTGSWLSLPVVVLNGSRPGPRLWLSAALHGDELNGMEIIRQVLDGLDPTGLTGAIIAVPIVNVFGFEQQTRYLPDRRDLNRSFPGSPRGSLASRLAHLFITEVVDRCQYGIDLHTGSHHRKNLPQIRADLTDSELRRIAAAFGAPMMYHAPPIRGSLRTVARQRGVRVLVYEAGEPLRFNPTAIETGVRGVLNVLAALEMWPRPNGEGTPTVFEASERRWLRASRSGIFHLAVTLGERVEKGQVIGHLADPLMRVLRPVRATSSGMVIGFTNNPLVHQGDALVHLASV
jgi:predicted deacylase